MSSNLVRRKMGGEGIRSVTRNSGQRETSAVDYPGPAFDVYVEYDHPITHRGTARAVLVRASMPLLPTAAEALIDRFGRPDAGADVLSDGLNEGVAVWVDEPCGVVLTAYRPKESWWKVEGRTTLQLETLDLARRADSPASSSLREILEQKHGSPATKSIDLDAPRVVTIPTMENETAKSSSITANPVVVPVVAPAAPLTIATWRPQVSAGVAPTKAPEPTAPATPQDRSAERITFVPPVYPPLARWLGTKGHVTLAIVVEADGTVAKRPRVVAVLPAGRGFAESAVDAVYTWRFNPAIHGGKPVKSTLTIDVEFE